MQRSCVVHVLCTLDAGYRSGCDEPLGFISICYYKYGLDFLLKLLSLAPQLMSFNP
jgi:hypothetical protein